MEIIRGKHGNKVNVYANTIEEEARIQISNLADYGPYRNSRIRIMPDVHAGKGCTIGTTMAINNAITPNLVGSDIGCGMLAAKLEDSSIDFDRLDNCIRKYIPSGFNIHDYPIWHFDLSGLRCLDQIDISRADKSLGSLGGGNHFIEVDYSEKDKCYYLVIHTGSRNLGVQVCNYYQKLAIKSMGDRKDRKELIKELKESGRENEISSEMAKLGPISIDKDLAYLTGENFKNYINDMEIVQFYAHSNRFHILDIIASTMGFIVDYAFETIHNYIDTFRMILRKGAVSAEFGERLIIPMNMYDGSLICVGKGNDEWNYSAPHGAGRLMSRTKAKENIKLADYEDIMDGIYSTSVNSSTIDEAPQAYKPMEEIISCIKDTVDIVDVIKPVYNFKAN